MTNKSSALVIAWKLNDGEFIEEVKIWRVPRSFHYPHGISFRLWFGRPGETLVLYDVHHGRRYHVHRGERVFEYEFRDVPTLLRDFFRERARYR